MTCKSASNLVNTDTLSLTDPYCKVRVKLDEDHPSTKDKTDYVSDTLNPAWGDGVSFTHRWEVELVSPQLEDDEEEPSVKRSASRAHATKKYNIMYNNKNN